MWRQKKDGIILFWKSLLTTKLIQKDCGSNEASLVCLGIVIVVAEARLAPVGCCLIDTFSMISKDDICGMQEMEKDKR